MLTVILLMYLLGVLWAVLVYVKHKTLFFQRLGWVLAGKPYIKYSGYNCGLCGAWINEEFEVATYRSVGQWDTWGICPNGCDWDEVARRNEEDLGIVGE